MKKLTILLGLCILTSCKADKEQPILKHSEYTIVDTTYVARNGFGYVLNYDVIILNHYDSLYHAGSLDIYGELRAYKVRPILIK